METTQNKRAALIIIGNEILSGRTQDKNTQHIAQTCAEKGVTLSEVRIVPDIESIIIDAVNTLRTIYDYVFTTGGIGPTHDDITAKTVAKAFGLGFGRHEGAYQILHEYYGADALNEPRASMADMPIDAGLTLIPNPVSAAPGFQIGNVFVMAGVPKIMQSMFTHVLDRLDSGNIIHSRTIAIEAPESKIANILSDTQSKHPNTEIGSYPQFKEKGWGVSVVLRGVDEGELEEVEKELCKTLQKSDVPYKIMG